MAYIGRPASAEVSVTGSTDTFTGDGNVAFTLSRVVRDSNPSLLEVFVSNVQQQPTVTFSVVNNVLTFTSAPEVGEPIYVTYRDYPVAPVFTIPDSSIVEQKIASLAVTEAKIAAGAVVEAKIAAGAVTTAKIADNAITTAKIEANAIIAIVNGGTGAITLALANIAVLNTFGTFSASQRGTVTTDNDGSFDMNATNNFFCTPSGNVTLTFTNITSGQSGNFLLVNTSNHTISAAAAIKVSSTALGTISATGTYWLSYFSPDGANVYVANTTDLE